MRIIILVYFMTALNTPQADAECPVWSGPVRLWLETQRYCVRIQVGENHDYRRF